jgi:hypothetical protein
MQLFNNPLVTELLVLCTIQPGAGKLCSLSYPKRYHAFVFIDQTSALHPIGTEGRNEPPDTYPSGF